MLGVFAEFERAILQERIHPGIARARKNGTNSGKPIGRARTNAKVEDAIRASLAAGKGIHKTARGDMTMAKLLKTSPSGSAITHGAAR
jgi:DNA invertase Pin-like site-specific DNA recombinase